MEMISARGLLPDIVGWKDNRGNAGHEDFEKRLWEEAGGVPVEIVEAKPTVDSPPASPANPSAQKGA